MNDFGVQLGKQKTKNIAITKNDHKHTSTSARRKFTAIEVLLFAVGCVTISAVGCWRTRCLCENGGKTNESPPITILRSERPVLIGNANYSRLIAADLLKQEYVDVNQSEEMPFSVSTMPPVAPSRNSGNSRDTKKATCHITHAKQKKNHRFNVVLLSTYPRSGNSWLRLLLHGATQYLDRGLATVRAQDTEIRQLIKFSTCLRTECNDDQISAFQHKKLQINPDPAMREQAETKTMAGINPKPTHESGIDCKHFMTLHDKGGWQNEIVPVSLKSHFPTIPLPQKESVEGITRAVSHVVHTVRNPFDNLASRYLGNHHSHQEQYDKLVKARARGETTKQFENFLETELPEYIKFHEYWLDRRLTDAARGIATLYTRYESLCSHTESIVREITTFGGWDLHEDSMQCYQRMAPCAVPGSAFPQHISLFTDKQISAIYAKTAHMLEQFGYHFDLKTKTLTYTNEEIPMCNGE